MRVAAAPLRHPVLELLQARSLRMVLVLLALWYLWPLLVRAKLQRIK